MKRYTSPAIRIHVVHGNHAILSGSDPSTTSANIVDENTNVQLSKQSNKGWGFDLED